MRRPVAAAALAALVAAVVTLAPGSPAGSACAAAGSHHAAVIVEHGDGSVVTRCVAFDPSQVSGEQLLDASGLLWSGQTFGGFGNAVCAVDGEPARYSTCPGKDSYWAVFVARSGGAWQLSNVGISTMALGDGDAEGLRYVPSSGTPAAPPPPAGACVAAPTAATTAPPATTATQLTPAPVGTAAPVMTPGPDVAPVSPGEAGARTPAVVAADSPAATTPGSPTASVSSAATAPVGHPNPSSPAGLDLGLLAAAVGGGALGGMALLRLFAARRPVR